ncbi:hypothetical protein AAH978_01860 [Streptomyces sp. ZYX-F-203]
MREDVGGTPFPDDGEPHDDHDRGASDEEFASVVFDEAFVRAAPVREPTATERLRAAARARAEAEVRRARHRGERFDDPDTEDGRSGGAGFDPSDAFDDPDAAPYGRRVRWHRPVAWVLAVVMGMGMVVLAFAAVYRGAASGDDRRQTPPPASTGPEPGGSVTPSTSLDFSHPAVAVTPDGG